MFGYEKNISVRNSLHDVVGHIGISRIKKESEITLEIPQEGPIKRKWLSIAKTVRKGLPKNRIAAFL